LKKIILFFTLVSVTFAYQYDAKFYVGIGGGSEVENYTNTNKKELDAATSAIGTIKFGYGDQKAYAIEFAFNYIQNDTNTFSKDDGIKYGLDITFIKAYPLTTYFYPFVKVGFGAGEMEVDQESIGEGAIGITLTEETKALQRQRISYSSYNVGFGAYFPFSETFEIELSYMYRYNSYQSLDYSEDNAETIETYKLQSHINQIYLGVNKRF